MEFSASLADSQFPTVVKYRIEIGYRGTENVGDPPSILNEIVALDDDVVFDRGRHILNVATVSWDDVNSGSSLMAIIRSLRNAFRGPQVLSGLARGASRVVNYRLEPRQLSQASLDPEPDTFVRLGYEGENLAAYLSWLSANEPDRFEQIKEEI